MSGYDISRVLGWRWQFALQSQIIREQLFFVQSPKLPVQPAHVSEAYTVPVRVN